MHSQPSRITQFEEDLAVLYDVLNTPSPLSPQKVRLVASSTVRKWLLDGHINQLAKELDVLFELPAYDTTEVFKSIENGAPINFFLAGGIMLGGIPIRSMYSSSIPFDGKPPIPADTPISLISPGKYINSKRLYHNGKSFSAERILLFVANKHGGVHLDFNRSAENERLLQAANYMTFGNPNGESKARVVELEGLGGRCMVVVPPEKGNLWSALEIEMLSAAQSLLNIHCNRERLLVTK